jgi:hypothetical protein
VWIASRRDCSFDQRLIGSQNDTVSSSNLPSPAWLLDVRRRTVFTSVVVDFFGLRPGQKQQSRRMAGFVG